MQTRVVKVGGSLLRLADLSSRLRSWLELQAPATNLVVVGGGQLVEELRQQQRLWGYSDELAHRLALRLMDINAQQLASVCPHGRLLSAWSPQLCKQHVGELEILECGEWAAGEEVFEPSWRTTSDSVAAEIAGRTGATELVVLKSALPEQAHAPASYVDPQFNRHLPASVLLRLVDFTSDGFPEIVGGR